MIKTVILYQLADKQRQWKQGLVCWEEYGDTAHLC